jgi:glycosyltransferase involved in cell wall biosynthesis
MKIAVVAPTSIPARRANTVQVMKMSQALAGLGHEVHLAAPGDPPAGKSPEQIWQELARHYGVRQPFPVDWLPAHPRLRRYDFGLRAVRWARSWRADLLYTRLPQAAAIASQIGMPVIFELHDLPQGQVGPWLLRRFLNGRGARRLVSISRVLADDLAGRFGERAASLTLVAPDAVDLERYAGLPAPPEARCALNRLGLPLPEGRFTAGYTGHLYPGRGEGLLLALAERLPEVSFLLVGGEPGDVAHVQAEARSRGLDNVNLTGFVPNAELSAYQAACEALLMPYEGRVEASSGGDISRYLSPMKLFEYLACGRAILASDLPVFREVLTEENAILLPTGNVNAWEAALRLLQANPERRHDLGIQARQAASRHTWDARARRILEGLA